MADARRAHETLGGFLDRHGARPLRTELPEPSGVIALENVSFIPPGAAKPIVRGLTLQVHSGETLVVVGPSGSGKSTLARLIVGVWPATTGVVRIDGADIVTWDRERLGRWIGYVPQDIQLFSGTVSENIARLAAVDSEAVIRAAQSAHAHEAILRLPHGYDTFIGECGALLSGGQRQRIALARAFYGEPRIIVLDEPNAYLDAEGEQALGEALAQLRGDGATVVLVTQRASILSHADRILVMCDGMVEKIGVRSDEGHGAGGSLAGAPLAVSGAR
jgi:ABC-type protease/lipase transport system fused ATPase/permease subunit